MRRPLAQMLLSLAAFLVLVMAINWIANPYAAWSAAWVDKAYLRIPDGVERMSTPYRIRTETPSTLLVGTSRMLYGVPIIQGYRDGVLNAALPAASIDETAATIELALRAPQLRRIVWSVDFGVFREDYRGFTDPATQVRFAGTAPTRVLDTLLSLDALVASGQLLLRAAGGRGRLPEVAQQPVPWPPAVVHAAFDAIESAPRDGFGQAALDQTISDWLAIYGHYRRSETQWELFRRTVQHVRDRRVELTLFVPPLHVIELETIRQSGAWPLFQAWKRELCEVSPYWDFSGYNQIAPHGEFYTLPTFVHFKPAVGHTLLRRVLGEDCADCGAQAQTVFADAVWIDPLTIDAHEAAQDAGRIRFVDARSQAVQMVERLRSTR